MEAVQAVQVVPAVETNYDDEKRKCETMNPSQWTAASKRLLNERETIEKNMLPKDMDLAREWNVQEKARAENLATTAKKVKWFKFHLDKICVRLNDQLSGGGILGEYYDQTAAKESLRTMLESFEQKLTTFKLAMRTEFDLLDEEERRLSEEIAESTSLIAAHEHQHLPSWEPHACGVSETESVKKKQQLQQRQQQELEQKAAIGEIDRELASMGRHGGWDVRDHDVFLRTWNVFFGNVDLLRREENPETKEVSFVFSLTPAQEKLLFKKLEHDVFAKSMEELEEHVRWYGKSMELLAKKKHLLMEWKAFQHSRKKTINNEVLLEEQVLKIEELALLEAEENEKRIKAEREKNDEEKRLEAKTRIVKWKSDRLKQQEEEMKQKEEALQQQKLAAEEKKKRQEALKMQVSGWKKEEALKAAVKTATGDLPKPPKLDAATIKQRHERDLELAKQRKVQADLQAMKKTERERKLHSVPNVYETEVPRDPSRLMLATKSSEAGRLNEEDLDAAQQRRATASAHGAPVAMSGRDLHGGGMRATPTWMKA